MDFIEILMVRDWVFFMRLFTIRTFLVSFVALASLSSSFAGEQVSSSAKTGKTGKDSSQWMFHWGPKAGIDFLQIDRPFAFSIPDESEMGIGVGAGLNARFEWRNKFYIQPGLMFSYDSATASASEEYNETDNESGSFRIRRGSLMLPIHLGYKFYVTTDFYMSLFTGVWASYGFSGMIDYNPGPAGEPDSEYVGNLYSADGVWNRVASGLALGLTLDIGSRLTVNVDGYIGLNQLAARNVFYSNYMSETLGRISLCYWIGSVKL